MARERKKRDWYWDGFRDALMLRGRDPTMGMPDSWTVAYESGYRDGEKAVAAIVAAARGTDDRC